MRTKTLYLLAVILLCSHCKSEYEALEANNEEQVTIDDFSFLTGSWDGALEYLNFGDDETRVTLPTRAVYKKKRGEIAYNFIYTEPGGEEVNGKGSINVKGGDQIEFNGGSHRLVGITREASEGLIEVKITRKGQDNGRDAQIDHVIQRKRDVLTITRYVLLEGASAPFVRHTYTFTVVD